MAGYRIEIIDDSWSGFEGLLELEYKVLYEDFGVAREQDWHHAGIGGEYAVALEGDRVVGSARLICGPDVTCQLRQVAVDPDRHGLGIGRSLVLSLEQRARERGVRETWLHARESAFGFYERLGYEYCSELFESELTRIPHRTMRKVLGGVGQGT